MNTFYGSYRQRKTWNGYHLFAVDGSSIQVPKTKDNLEYFGICRNRHHSREDAMARISILYDLLDDIIVDGSINITCVQKGLLQKTYGLSGDLRADA